MNNNKKSLLKAMIEKENKAEKPSDKMKYLISAIIIPIFVMLFSLGYSIYQNQRTIELESISQISLLDSSTDPFFKEIKIYRNDEELSNISRIDFSITNIGRLDITKEDIVRPIRIIFTDNPKIFSVVINSKQPKDMEISLTKSDSSIDFNFDLMNPNDKFIFSVYTDKLVSNFSATAGIKNLSELRIKKFEEKNDTEKKTQPWYIWLGWIFDFFWFLCVLIFFRIRKQLIRFEKENKTVATLVSRHPTFQNLKDYLTSNLDAIFVDKDIKKLEKILSENEGNYEQSKKELILFIESEISGQLYGKTAYFIFLVLSIGFAVFLYKSTL
ncbi:hypothetical protein JWG40_10495 [Leptospira sp. 201903074]|uniref:hypothetical protein n=1 Tax=Leptospira abararensis TaxID=2810036 RepID=UPI0019634953|nr:hypothetical protein [Leptospira abararensis]MBM9547446.1 hypothetical protein [Leptospira abararensis]